MFQAKSTGRNKRSSRDHRSRGCYRLAAMTLLQFFPKKKNRVEKRNDVYIFEQASRTFNKPPRYQNQRGNKGEEAGCVRLEFTSRTRTGYVRVDRTYNFVVFLSFTWSTKVEKISIRPFISVYKAFKTKGDQGVGGSLKSPG